MTAGWWHALSLRRACSWSNRRPLHALRRLRACHRVPPTLQDYSRPFRLVQIREPAQAPAREPALARRLEAAPRVRVAARGPHQPELRPVRRPLPWLPVLFAGGTPAKAQSIAADAASSDPRAGSFQLR